MLGRTIAALLIFGWVCLSAFDVLEDLKVSSEDTAYTQSGKEHSPDGKRLSTRVNNMVESAVKAPTTFTPLLRPNNSQWSVHPLWSLQRSVDLHTLHRVFLI
jgi:hypothetical protein